MMSRSAIAAAEIASKEPACTRRSETEMPYVCPQGHDSGAADHCEICAVDPPDAPAATRVIDSVEPAPAVEVNPVELPGTEVVPVIPAQPLTSTAVRGSDQSAQVSWVVEILVDPAWYEGQQTTHSLPAQASPVVVPLRGASALIGRRSTTRGTDPEIDLSADPGVSRRHARLLFRHGSWLVEDLNSSNGTFVAHASATLPELAIDAGVPVPIQPDDQIYLGAWTRLALRPARDGERR